MRTLIAITTLALLATASAQDDPLAEPVKDLRHDEIERRDRAEAALLARGESVVPRLRELADRERDPEARERLKRVIARLTGLEWHADLASALAKAQREGKRVLALSSPAAFDAPS
jgi:hypothetical protein